MVVWDPQHWGWGLPFGRGRDTSFMVPGRKSEMMGADASRLVASSWMRMFLIFVFSKKYEEKSLVMVE